MPELLIPNSYDFSSITAALEAAQPIPGYFKRPRHLSVLPKLRVDWFVGRIAIAILFIYIVLYGMIDSHGFYIHGFNLGYAVIILPIWIVDGMRSLVESFLTSEYKYAPEELDKVTVIIACKDGEPTIGRTITSLLTRFQPEQVIVASNGSTDNTVKISQDLGVVCLDNPIAVGKVRAINAALEHVTTPYVLLIDDDTLIGKARIPTGLLGDDGYEAVAFRVLVKETSWITKFQMYEYRKSTDVGKRYSNRQASVQNISGAIGLFHTKELQRQVPLHSGEFSGEDLQRTLLIHLAAVRKGVVLANSIVLTEAPRTLKALFNQRVYGWFPGLYSSFPNYLRLASRRKVPLVLRVDAAYNCFLIMMLDVVRLLTLPVLLFYPWYFVVLYVVYLALETVTFIKHGFPEPYWVLIFYPFYGLFGILTRICAFMVFLQKRFVKLLSRVHYLDDYRQTSQSLQLACMVLITVGVMTLLLLNDRYNYTAHVLNFFS